MREKDMINTNWNQNVFHSEKYFIFVKKEKLSSTEEKITVSLYYKFYYGTV